MAALAGARRGPLVSVAVLCGAIAVVSASAASGRATTVAIPAMFTVVAVTVFARREISWRGLVGMTILVILFVPIKKYSLPASLPINLELYRLVVAVVAAFWITAALLDRQVKLRRGGLIDKPLVVFVGAIIVSEIANPSRVALVGSDYIKAVLFFFSYLCILYIVASVIRTREDIDALVATLVRGGAVVAFFCLIESKTNYNVFDHLHTILPILSYSGGVADFSRGSHLRVFGSSQHPIAMGAALMMLVPLAFYRAFALRRKVEWVLAFVLTLGAMATISRTAIVMLLVVVLVFVAVRPRQMRSMWPAIFPALIAVHFAVPGLIGSVQASFFPKGGLVAQQTNQAVGSGRLATLWPALHTEFSPDPIVGEGFGTRITTPDDVVKVPNAPILDDQWLGILLETGIVGAFSLAWMFIRFARRAGREAKHDPSSRGWLLGAIVASVSAYGVSMLFYDAFSFIQVTFLLFILIGLGSAAYKLPRPDVQPT